MTKPITPKRSKTFRITTDIRDQLRSIASQLPKLPEQISGTKPMKGSDLLKEGHTHIKSGGIQIPINIAQSYNIPFIRVQNINHYEKLMNHYKKGGIWATFNYLLSLDPHEEKMKEKYPDLFDKDGNYIPIKKK